MNEADDLGLDLVQMGEQDDIAVCKILNYSKFIYEKQKRAKKNKKVVKAIKEIRISPNIADYDLGVRARNIDKLIKEGHSVRVCITYRGREINLCDVNNNKITSLLEKLTVSHKIKENIKRDGNRISCLLVP